jgi:hypothetical protein
MAAIRTITGSNRYYGVSTQTVNVPGYPYLEIGPAGTTQGDSVMMIQFNPSENFAGNFVVLGKMLGQAAQDKGTPFVPIPYRVGSLNGVAQVDINGNGWPWSIAPISGAALIRLPSGGVSIIIELGLEAGQMDILTWGLDGNSAV